MMKMFWHPLSSVLRTLQIKQCSRLSLKNNSADQLQSACALKPIKIYFISEISLLRTDVGDVRF